MGKDSFVIYKSFFKPISKLSDKQLGRLFRAIFEYNISGVVSVEEDIEMAFEFFKNQFDIDESKYQGKVERNRENGRRGGNQKAENDKIREVENKVSKRKQSVANGSECQRNLANLAYNENDNDNEKDIKERELSNDSPPKKETSSFPQAEQSKFFETDKQDKIDYKRIVDMYHKACPDFPKVFKLSDTRKQKIRIRFEEMDYSYETMATLFLKTQTSKFLRGDNRNGWKATFDWLFENPKNWVKVVEGQYDNPETKTNQPNSARLGKGEWIAQDGRRTYGTGRANVPMDAPPRPSDQYAWINNQWVIL